MKVLWIRPENRELVVCVRAEGASDFEFGTAIGRPYYKDLMRVIGRDHLRNIVVLEDLHGKIIHENYAGSRLEGMVLYYCYVTDKQKWLEYYRRLGNESRT